MHCANCRAPVGQEPSSTGVCRHCGTGLGRAQAPAVDQGVAEILAALGLPGGAGATAVPGDSSGPPTRSSSFVVDGKTYERLEDMPAEVRRRVEEKMEKLAALGFVVPPR